MPHQHTRTEITIADGLHLRRLPNQPDTWSVHGHIVHSHGYGTRPQMVRLAQAILESLANPTLHRPKDPATPTVDLPTELAAIRGLTPQSVQALTALATDQYAGSPGELARAGATLRALADHLLREAVTAARREGATTDQQVAFSNNSINLPFIPWVPDALERRDHSTNAVG